MKLAFHFNRLHPELGNVYGSAAWRMVFPALLDQRGAHVMSKIFVGDLLFRDIDTSRDGLEFWLHPRNLVWTRLLEERLTAALPHVYAICFESVDQETAERLHGDLVDSASYLGAMEVDDGSFVHWQLYSEKLVPRFRVLGSAAHVFWDGFSEDGKDHGSFEEVQSLGFDPVLCQNSALLK